MPCHYLVGGVIHGSGIKLQFKTYGCNLDSSLGTRLRQSLQTRS